MRGKLIVIEGSDGAGKTTQQGLLKAYIEKQNYQVKSLKFPQYETSFFGKMVAQFLRGEFGPLETVNPYLISTIYAMDRASAKEKMDGWLEEGNFVVLDRYATSNQAHQCGRLPKRERNKFLAWDVELEYEVNKIPREDIVIYLNIPYKISQKLLRNSDRDRGYAKGKKKDMVEKDMTYLKNAEETYKWLAKKFPHWVTIHCVDEEGNLRSREDIHEEIKKILQKKRIIPALLA